jgi:proteasome lid subunit RPN8/RPN11
MIIFTDRILAQLDEHIGRYPAERGGALMALPNSNIVTSFIFDPEAEMTSASYVPSAALTVRVQAAEQEQGLTFCGVVHSHPGNFDQPSSQDDVAFRKGLDINPHLARFIAPIMTHDRQAKPNVPHEHNVGAHARMSCYVAFRASDSPSPDRGWNAPPQYQDRYDGSGRPVRSAEGYGHGGRPTPLGHFPVEQPRLAQVEDRADPNVLRERSNLVRLMRTPMQVMPLARQMSAVRQFVEKVTRGEVFIAPGPLVELGGVTCLSETVTYRGGDLTIIVPPTFPFTAPVVILGRGQRSQELQFEWNLDDALRPDSLARRLVEGKQMRKEL